MSTDTSVCVNVKSEIAKRVGVAFTLSSFWVIYNAVFRTLAIIAVVILIGSCIVLLLRERVSQSRWKWLLGASMFELTFTALGLSMLASGGRLIASGEGYWWALGALLAGFMFVGIGIGENISIGLRYRKSKAEHKGETA